jgi:hypothetical protein
MDRREQQATFQQSQMQLDRDRLDFSKEAERAQNERFFKAQELDTSRLKLDQITSDLNLRNEAAEVARETGKKMASLSLGDFASVYDPTDLDHRSKLDWYRNWAQGEGVTAQEVNQGLANVDNKTAALDNHLAALRASSGIQDWETITTPDGRTKIDVGATVAKSDYLKRELDTAAQTWTHNDRMLETALTNAQSSIDPSKRQGSAQIRAMVNENRRILTDYQTVVGEGLFVPPDNFEERFVKRGNPSDPTVSKDQIGYAPVMYNRDVLELDPAYLKARGYAVRIAGGEEPELARNKDTGEIEYETLRGGGKVAKIARWVDTKRVTAIAEADKKQADAVSARAGAAYDQQYGTIARNADAASKIQNAISLSPDAATRTAGQAAISTLIKGGAPTNAGQFVPVNTGVK